MSDRGASRYGREERRSSRSIAHRAPFRDTTLTAALASLAVASPAVPHAGGLQTAGGRGRRRPLAAVQANDDMGGNVALRVYDRIQGEIARAGAAGQDAQARRLVAGSRRRHGHPQ